MKRRVGMTGTRNGMSLRQLDVFDSLLNDDDVLHHGCCVGADKDAHLMAFRRYIPIVGHPPHSTTYRMDVEERQLRGEFHHVFPDEPYHNRNRAIVAMSDIVIATPFDMELQTGGTWYTIKYAKSQRVPVYVIRPDGEVVGW